MSDIGNYWRQEIDKNKAAVAQAKAKHDECFRRVASLQEQARKVYGQIQHLREHMPKDLGPDIEQEKTKVPRLEARIEELKKQLPREEQEAEERARAWDQEALEALGRPLEKLGPEIMKIMTIVALKEELAKSVGAGTEDAATLQEVDRLYGSMLAKIKRESQALKEVLPVHEESQY